MKFLSSLQIEILRFWAKRYTKHQFLNGFKRIYFFHIRKCGGTSLNKMFLALSDNSPHQLYKQLVDAPGHMIISKNIVYVGWNKKLINKGDYFYAFSHLPLHKLQLPPKTFTITCFRDPVTRVISHYNMLLFYKYNNINHPCMKIEEKWLGNSFSDFLHNIPKKHLLNQLYMFSKNFDINEALRNIEKSVCYYFFTEEFTKGIIELNQVLDFKLVPLHERQSRQPLMICKKDKELLKDKLKKEYDMIKVLKRWIT